MELKKIPLSQQLVWEQKISEMRGDFDEFMKQIPEQMQDPLFLYWSGGLCLLMSTKYCQIMQRDLSQLKPL